ncbi:helix-turn-helix domain-containing protein [Halobaculum litoreum]|uniref:Helix-turn-helix domain-containing protein n=1 Tax=Halobaculum litoreum TaxID=3031998 RepID=A0ABD5XPN0_9EURY
MPIDDRSCYCLIEGRAPAESRALWEHFTRGSLMTVPPVEWNDDGSSTVTLVGTEADVQAAVAAVPGDIRVDVERVGRGRIDRPDAGDALTDRQREALATAVDLGYYDTPRGATIADVAAALGRSRSTVGEHLQRAEATVITRLFE